MLTDFPGDEAKNIQNVQLHQFQYFLTKISGICLWVSGINWCKDINLTQCILWNHRNTNQSIDAEVAKQTEARLFSRTFFTGCGSCSDPVTDICYICSENLKLWQTTNKIIKWQRDRLHFCKIWMERDMILFFLTNATLEIFSIYCASIQKARKSKSKQ